MERSRYPAGLGLTVTADRAVMIGSDWRNEPSATALRSGWAGSGARGGPALVSGERRSALGQRAVGGPEVGDGERHGRGAVDDGLVALGRGGVAGELRRVDADVRGS